MDPGAGSGEVDVDGDGSTERVSHGRGADHLRVQLRQRLGGRVRREAHLHLDRFEARVAAAEAEEGVQIDVTLQVELERIDSDAGDRRVRRLTDREAVAQRREELLDGIGRRVVTAERIRLVRGDKGTSVICVSYGEQKVNMREADC